MSPIEEVGKGLHEIIKRNLMELKSLGFEFEPNIDPLDLQACQKYAEEIERTLSILRRLREQDPQTFEEIARLSSELREVDLSLKMG